MRYLLILIMLFSIAGSYSYDDQLMQIYAKIAPRLVLMSKTTHPLPEKSIDITLLYEKGDESAAENLREKMLKIYPKGLKNRKLKIELVPYDMVKKLRRVSLLFLLESDADSAKAALNFARKKSILTISYNSRFLSQGAILSLYVGRSVKPFLNLEAAKKSGITFDNVLFAISKIYLPEGVQ